jgi:peptidoglycan/xylan/chitin deacetylase (PgdA/CDA1 family)
VPGALALLLAAATVGVGAAAPTAAHGQPKSAPVPILEYHVIGVPPPGAPLGGLYVTPNDLRAQMAWLARNGWHSVGLGAVARNWKNGSPLPRKPIVLSFDDGYPGDWRYALPILHEQHFAGVLNLQIGNLVPARVRQLIRAGWEIDSHTFTHPDLRTVSDPQIIREVVTSRQWLQRTFHIPVPAFCYPFGFYDDRVIRAVGLAGYLVAETEHQGWASPSQGLFTLSRIRVTSTTGVTGLAAWLGR